jgi:hypothetical protein
MTIFVSIASYEDPFLIDTIKDAIDKANNPNNLFFGIALQYSKTNKPDLDFINKENLITLEIPVSRRPGLVRIRHLLRKMVTFQEYFLQIDSHTKFDYNWDIKLIKDLENLKQITHEKVIISKRVGVELGDLPSKKLNLKNKFIFNDFTRKNNILLSIDPTDKKVLKEDVINNRYYKNHFASGHFIFCDSQCIKNVITDGISQNYYEEMFDSFYFYIQGYDIYSVYGYNHLAHDNRQYRTKVYGSDTLISGHPSIDMITRNSAINDDDMQTYVDINEFVLYNIINRFDVGSKRCRSNYEFFKEIGLGQMFADFGGIE